MANFFKHLKQTEADMTSYRSFISKPNEFSAAKTIELPCKELELNNALNYYIIDPRHQDTLKVRASQLQF